MGGMVRRKRFNTKGTHRIAWVAGQRLGTVCAVDATVLLISIALDCWLAAAGGIQSQEVLGKLGLICNKLAANNLHDGTCSIHGTSSSIIWASCLICIKRGSRNLQFSFSPVLHHSNGTPKVRGIGHKNTPADLQLHFAFCKDGPSSLAETLSLCAGEGARIDGSNCLVGEM